MQPRRIVVIGGGAGTDMLLAGLKRYNSRLTALISTFDSSSRHREGGSRPGYLADEMRSSLLALGADPPTTRTMERLFDHHLSAARDSVSGNFGYLFLSTLAGIMGTPELALKAATQVLNVRGQVLPLTLHECPLVAELNNGVEATVRSPAELIAAASNAGLKGVRLARPTPILKAAEEAIRQADLVVLGPADFYFGVLAPLLIDGVSEALAASGAVKVFVCNILTQPHTTGGWNASHFAQQLLSYIRGGLPSVAGIGDRGSGGGGGGRPHPPHPRSPIPGKAHPIDYVIVNSAPLSPGALARSAAEGSFPVSFDLEACLSLGMDVIVRPLVSQDKGGQGQGGSHGGSPMYDPEKLARTVLFLVSGPPARRHSEATLGRLTPPQAPNTNHQVSSAER